MSQQTVNFGGTAVAEPPAPVLPGADVDSVSGDNRRKLLMVGAGVGVLVLAIVAFFVLKGGGSSSNDNGGFVVPHHAKHVAAGTTPQVVTLPKKVTTPVGRDPFKALYVPPVNTGTTSTSTSKSGSTTSTTSTTTTSGTTSTSTSSAQTYHPVWIQLKSVTSTSATFLVGYSNGKTLRAIPYPVKAPASGSRTTFASSFALLSDRNGTVTVQYGDGTPLQLDKQHNFMVVD